jgi:hypothetical protein
MAHKFNIDAVHIQTSIASHTEHQISPYIQTFYERDLREMYLKRRWHSFIALTARSFESMSASHEN